MNEWCIYIAHWSQTQFLEGHSSAEFSSNPNQTHLIQVIKVFRITRNFQVSVIWSWLELNCAELWPSRNWVWDHRYSALLYFVVHPKHFTIMWGGGGGGGVLLNHHQCAASTWMMRRLPQNNSTSALTTHQLQVERRESHRANQVYALTTHQLQVERRESHRTNQVDGDY